MAKGAGSDIYARYIAPPAEPTPIIVTVTQTPEPTETPWVYQEPEDLRLFRTGGHYLGEPFVFSRDNVSMGKDLTFKLAVYDAVFKDSYEWNSRSWGQTTWFTQHPLDGQKYLFIFVRLEGIGDKVEDDARMWAFDSQDFYVQYGMEFIKPDSEHVPCTVIRDFENTHTVNDDVIVSDFGYTYTHLSNIQNDTYSEAEPNECQPTGYLQMGKSNAIDGYIQYQVPESARMEDLKIVAGLSGFGQAYWELKRR